MTIPTESQEQVTLITWAYMVRGQYPELQWLFHVGNGGVREPRAAERLKKEGVRPGVPDLILMLPRGVYHGLAIEMKRQDGGRLSKEQKAWLENLNSNGYRAVVCKGFEEARREILDYLSL